MYIPAFWILETIKQGYNRTHWRREGYIESIFVDNSQLNAKTLKMIMIPFANLFFIAIVRVSLLSGD